MAAAKQAPLVSWAWKTDQGNWHAYPGPIAEALEDAWKGKVTRFPVDAERFVDTVKMIQKRLDMTGKAREVKRELLPALKNHVFGFIGIADPLLLRLIATNGGLATRFITEKVTLALCDNPAANAEGLAEAKELNIPVLSSDAVRELIDKRENADLAAFVVDLKKVAVSNGAVGSSKAQPAAKPKLAAKNNGEDLPKPQGLPWRNGYSRPFDASTEWMGAWHPDGEVPIVVSLEVNFFSASGEWIGLLTAPASNSKVQVSGILIPGGGPPMENAEPSHTIYMRTKALISGSEKQLQNLTLPKGHLDASTKTIKFGSSLSLSYIRHNPSMPYAFIQPGTIWKGTSSTNVARFELAVASNDGAHIEGSITWPEFAAVNTFQGSYTTNGEVTITERPSDVVLDDVEMPPTTYSLNIIPQLTTDLPKAAFLGTWSSETDSGPSSGQAILTPVP